MGPVAEIAAPPPILVENASRAHSGLREALLAPTGLREALLAPTAAPALPDAVRSLFRPAEEQELRTPWSRASIRHWRQQSVPHSGRREALLAPTATPALPDAERSLFKHPPKRG